MGNSDSRINENKGPLFRFPSSVRTPEEEQLLTELPSLYLSCESRIFLSSPAICSMWKADRKHSSDMFRDGICALIFVAL